MITISPIPRSGQIVVHHPTDAGKVRQFTGSGAPQWVDLAEATYSECAVALEQIGTTGLYAATLDLPDDATYPILLYGTDATGFDDQVIAQMTWYPEPATSAQVSEAKIAIVEHGDSNWAGEGDSGGSGAWSVTITVQDADGQPVPGARVRVSRGLESHVQTVGGDGGAVTFNLDDGAWTVAITRAGYTFGGATLTVDGADVSKTYTMDAVVIAPPAQPGQTTGYLTTCDAQGNPVAGKVVHFRLREAGGLAGGSYPRDVFSATSGANGLLEVTLMQGATYEAWRDRVKGQATVFQTGSETTFQLPEVLGAFID